GRDVCEYGSGAARGAALFWTGCVWFEFTGDQASLRTLLRSVANHLSLVRDASKKRERLTMQVIAYHCVLSTYGFWLPNDTRGSNSFEVRAINLKPFGPATPVTDTRRSVANRRHDRALRLAAKKALIRPEVEFTGLQARSVAAGFGNRVRRSGYRVRACSILPQHVHLVISRHWYSVEQVGRLLRQSGTAQLLADELHPFEREPNGRLPSVWGQDF